MANILSIVYEEASGTELNRDYRINQNYNKILESDWLSTGPI